MMPLKEPLYDRDQGWLFPPSLDDLVSADSEVRLVDSAMECLDWSKVESSYSDRGRPAYSPRVLAKVLVYAYSKGVRSSRKIAELVRNDVRFMWLAKMERPDFHTIARFRKDRFGELGELFGESVRLCAGAGLVLLSSVSVDGTKVAADVSKSSLYDQDRIARERSMVDEILHEAEEVDACEDREYGDWDGQSMPEEMKDPEVRRKRLEELAGRMRDEKCKQMSATDPDCRMMHTGRGNVQPCYNVQAAVDSANQIVVAADVTNAARDSAQLPGMVEQVRENVGMCPDVVLADAGYSSESSLTGLSEMGQEALVPACGEPRCGSKVGLSSDAFVRDRKRDVLICPMGKKLGFMGEHRAGSGRYRRYSARGCKSCDLYEQCVPSGRGSRQVSLSVIADLREAMRRKLDSADGKRAFALRKYTVEPVFGHFKRNLGFDRFMLRGLAGVAAEVYLVATAHNIMKWATAQLSSRKWARLLCASLLRRFVSRPAFIPRLTSHAPA